MTCTIHSDARSAFNVHRCDTRPIVGHASTVCITYLTDFILDPTTFAAVEE
jgi:hypothetical protein